MQYNKVHGFYIEVTSSNLDRVPADYQRRQTLKNAERYVTPELRAFEDKALSAQERSLAREKLLYEALLDALQPALGPLGELARALSALDALGALTERALTLDWSLPEFVAHPCIEIERGRHPVVEARLAETDGGAFIANDCRLDARTRMLIITGPNMGGKSTFMRQVALIALLGRDRLLRAGRELPPRADRCDPHAYRRGRRPRQRAVDLPARDDRGRGHRAHGHRPLARADGRDRARHLDLRRPRARRRDRDAPARAQPRLHAVRDALFRAHRLGPTRHPRAQHACLGRGERRPDRLPPRDRGRPREPQLRRAGGQSSPACPASTVRQARATLEALEVRAQ